MEEKRLVEMYGDVKAIRNDLGWVKEKIAYQNGVLAEHIKDSDEYRMQVTRNTVWRHAFKIAVGGLFVMLMWIIFK